MQGVTFFKDGEPVSGETLLRMEVRRARHMMAMLARKLDAAAMAKLFAEEIALSASQQLQWRQGETFSESLAVAHVAEGSAAEFLEWYVTGYLQANTAAMLRAHPEHLGVLQLPGGIVGVLEVTGHSHGPELLRAKRLEDWSGIPIPLEPDMPYRLMARSESEDGQVVGYLLHQYRDTNPGFDARLAIYWPGGAPEALVKGHADHLMVEFNNWFQMYLQTRKQPADLMPVALTVNS
ncbi:hypothetical protein [Bradyrhizobium sp. HKCCYLS20291]|uniref:hypothetical protein n=1 Tax=Bradyrhizobium sp. HKCCYLS20291 TaxID=3420766 RepID=UPI003EBAC42D